MSLAAFSRRLRWPFSTDYQRVSQYDDGARFEDEEGAILLAEGDVEYSQGEKPRKPAPRFGTRLCGRWSKGKVFATIAGAVFLIAFVLYGMSNRDMGAVSDGAPPTANFANMPGFTSSLECSMAPHFYNSSSSGVTVHAPIGSWNMNHFLDVRGGGVGTVTLAAAREDSQSAAATDVEYSIKIRSNSERLLERVQILQKHMHNDEDGSVRESRLVLGMPYSEDEEDCINFEVVLYIPKALEKLHVASHATKMHVRYHPDADIELGKSLYVTMYGVSSENMILPSLGIRAPRIGLEIFNGWIMGNLSLSDYTSIKTQRGMGSANVTLHPTMSPGNEPAMVETITGRGRTNITYLGGQGRRPIRSVHLSTSPKSEMKLDYSSTGFSGRVEMDATLFSAPKVEMIAPGSVESGVMPTEGADAGAGATTNADDVEEEDDPETSVMHHEWTHFVDKVDGPDELRVDTRGRVEINF